MDPVDTVLLRHARRADTHLDWMIDLPDGGAGLATFRCDVPWPSWTAAGRVPLLALPTHRRAWLKREGALTGGRGRVHRLASGRAHCDGVHRHGWGVRLAWPGGQGFGGGEFAGHVVRLRADRWEFVASPPSPRRRPPAAGLPRPGLILRPRPGIAR